MEIDFYAQILNLTIDLHLFFTEVVGTLNRIAGQEFHQNYGPPANWS